MIASQNSKTKNDKKFMTPKFIRSAGDLQTKHRAICDGFLAQAMQKTEKARPYVEEARVFYAALKKIKTVEYLLLSKRYRSDLIAACGFSGKALARLTEAELNNAMKEVLVRIHRESGREFRENILYRYLLTKGDALGGSMRNITGASAGAKLAEKIIEKLVGSKHKIVVAKSGAGKIQRIAWNDRLLLFDVKPRIIGKNIDVILIKKDNAVGTEESLLADKDNYIACGELKGGIDPAGADEHWKTANSALGRIRTAFGRNVPALFFIGAAIESSMAKEIFGQLRSGKLTHAANLNEEKQVDDLVGWLLSL